MFTLKEELLKRAKNLAKKRNSKNLQSSFEYNLLNLVELAYDSGFHDGWYEGIEKWSNTNSMKFKLKQTLKIFNRINWRNVFAWIILPLIPWGLIIFLIIKRFFK